MKIHIWIKKEEAISGNITKYYNSPPQSSDWPNKRSAYHHARNLVQDYLFNDIIDKVHKAFPELKYEDNKPLASEQNVVKVGKQDEHKEHKRNT